MTTAARAVLATFDLRNYDAAGQIIIGAATTAAVFLGNYSLTVGDPAGSSVAGGMWLAVLGLARLSTCYTPPTQEIHHDNHDHDGHRYPCTAAPQPARTSARHCRRLATPTAAARHRPRRL